VIRRRPKASWKDLSVESGHCQAEDYFTDLIQRWLKGDCSSFSLIDCYVLLMILF